MWTYFRTAVGALFVSAAAADCTEVDASSAVLSASHDNTINSNEGYSRAFDSDVTTKWLIYEALNEPVWVQAVLTEPTVVTKYGITTANDAEERDPSSWALSGSNDGVYFVTLDVQSGVIWDDREERMVFTVSNSATYTYFRFDFYSVRDMSTANSLQLNYISLYEGDCEDPCCGIECGENGDCIGGECVCITGYEGSSCDAITVEFAEYDGRSISGATPTTSTTTADLAACKEICIKGNADFPCIGVNFAAATGACDVVTGAVAWTLAVAEGTTSALLISANLADPQDPESKSVEQQVAYVVDWNPPGHQMPRVDMYIGESVTFSWDDMNLRNKPSVSDANHHNVYLFAGEAQYQRCDFRSARVVAVAPLDVANAKVMWSSATEGKYYFGSQYGTDCSVGQLKMIVEVARRPTP